MATTFWGVVALFYSGLPNIKEIAGPLATVMAAAAAAFVAYTLGKAQIDVAERNWQTANEKLVLELFERRIAVFEEIRSAVSGVLRTGQPTDGDYLAYCRAIDRAPYYFGSEVGVYLEKIRLLIIELQLDATIIADHHASDQHARIWGRVERMKELAGFYDQAGALFGPYIKAHQKIVSSD
ncbi:hypothetical protein LPW26_01670 [Rhodopseudomonas sp. HC1]|uniref:hypothetical protein n=1 Tax=Rhodopseudomonas infernalis TaxID=2897386 RepID=UPI001EE843DF|nr:hypothetical protein [Rhodopseudomonas infernalis]MCG6203334.1 hypothetical protein [Rhodopseudomonas infernalis]